MMDLFGDLPEPTAVTTPKVVDALVVSKDVEEKRPIRKRCFSANDSGNGDDSVAKKALKDHYLLKGFVAERKGEREEMQDAHVIVEDFSSFLQFETDRQISLFAVFDGHGGVHASKFAAQNLHKIIAQKFPKGMDNFEKEIRKCFIDSFKKLDEDFLNEARKNRPCWKDGSTAAVVLVVDNVLYIANLGDSKAILCRYSEANKKLVALPLTADHNPTLYDERMRIQKAGGHVREGRVMGVLEVSRSIGDGHFKQLGVTCLPDIKRCQLTDNDKFIVIACDGLWKRFADDSANEFISEIIEDEKIKPADDKNAEHFRMDTACNALANEALRRLSADNVTILLIAIKPSPNVTR